MSEWIVGRNPVFETLRAGRRSFHELRLAGGMDEGGRVQDVLDLANDQGLKTSYVERRRLDPLGENHQGLALQVGPYPYVQLEDILGRAKGRGEPPFLLMLDVLKDPQNVGTLIRTAEAVGVHGIVLPYRRTATVTPAVVSASSGACEHMLVTQANLAQTIATLKDEGCWVVGLEMGKGAQPPDEIDLSGSMVIVVGSEGSGMRRLVRESCDFLMALPMRGKVDSLNASVAGSISLFIAWQARDFNGAERPSSIDGGSQNC